MLQKGAPGVYSNRRDKASKQLLDVLSAPKNAENLIDGRSPTGPGPEDP
jgi:hypothetical protein